MTKRNAFGDTIFGPEDNPGDLIAHLDDEGLGSPYEAETNEDPNFGWCALIRADEGEVEVHGFKSRDDLVDWLVDLDLSRSAIIDV